MAEEILGITFDFRSKGINEIEAELRRVLTALGQTGLPQGQVRVAQSQARDLAREQLNTAAEPKGGRPALDNMGREITDRMVRSVSLGLDSAFSQLDINNLIGKKNREALQQKFGVQNPEYADQLNEQLQRKLRGAAQTEVFAGDSQGGKEYRTALVRATRANQLMAAKVQEELAATDALAKAKARETIARNRIRAQVARELNSNEGVKAEADARLAERRNANRVRNAVASNATPDDIQREATANFAERRQRAGVQRQEADILGTRQGQALLQEEGLLAAERKKQRAAIEQATQRSLANDTQYILATAAAKNARQIQAAKIALAANGESFDGLGDDDLLARAAVSEKAQADRRAAAAANAQAAMGRQGVEAAVQRRNAEGRLRAAEAQLERAYIREAVSRGELGGTTFQRLQSRFSPQARAPQEFQTLNQFVGQKVVQTAGYGLGAALFYGALTGAGQLLDEAEKLQRIFVEIDSQLQSMGQGSQLGAVKQEVLDIAALTGQASDEVGKVAFQFIGAFQGDIPKALQETESAMKLVEVTGLELGEVVDSLTAISITYGVTITQIGDTTLGLQERFGVLSKEIVTFVGDTAAVADEAKISFQDLAAIGAIAQQQSGKSGAVLAEQFNRIIPAISDSKVEILSLYSLMGQGSDEASQQFAKSYDNILAAFSDGRTGDVFKQIAADFDSLSEPQRQAVYSQLGGKREAQTLIAILRDSQRLQNEFNANQADPDRDQGQLQKKFEDIQQTLTNTQARLSETFKQIGEALLQSGISDILVDLANGLSTILQIGSGIISVFSTINGLLGGLPGGLAKGVAIALLLNKAFVALSGTRGAAALAGLTQAASSAAVAGAANAEATAVTRAAAADTAEAAASTASAGANTAQATALTAQAQAAIAAANAQNLGALPAPPGRGTAFLGSGIGSRIFSGGRFLRSGVADGAAARTGAAAGASGLGIAAIATAGILAVKSSYDQNGTELAQQAGALREKLREKNVEEIRKIAESHTEGWALIGTKIFFEDLPEDIAQQELGLKESEDGRRYIQALMDSDQLKNFTDRISDDNLEGLRAFASEDQSRVIAAQQAGLQIDASGFLGRDLALAPIDRSKLAEALPKLKEAAANKDQAAQDLVQRIETVLNDQTDLAGLREILDDLVGGGKTKEALDTAGSVETLLSLRVDPLKARRDAGLATDYDVESTLRNELNNLRPVIASETNDEKLEQYLTEEAAAEKELDEMLFARLSKTRDSYARISELGGGTADQRLNLTLQTLARPELRAVDRLDLLPTALEDFEAKIQEELDNIKDPLARAQRAAQGFEVPDELQSALNEEQLLNLEPFQKFLSEFSEANGIPIEGLSKEVADLMALLDITAQEAILRIIDARIAEVKALIGEAGREGEVPGELRDRLAELERIRGETASTPFNVAQLAARAVKSQRELDEDLAQAAEDRAAGYLDLAGAYAEGNPVAEAQVAIQRAQLELQSAVRSGDEGKIASAQGNLVRAQRQASRAAFAIVQAQAEFLRVAADGDPIREAQASIQIAYLQLQQAIRDGDAAGQIDAQGNILAGQQALRDGANDIIRSQLELAKAMASQDPATQAGYDIALADFDIATARGEAERNRAIIARIEAARQQKAEAAALQDSEFDILAAQAERNPLAAAQLALRRADAAAQRAETQAERNQAIAQRIQAEHAIEDAIAAIAQSQIDVLIAMAEYAGDTVESANLALRKAQEELNRLRAQGAGEEQINQAQAEVIRARAAQRDAKLEDRLGDIEYLQQIGNITTAQAIEMLEAVAQIPDLTEDQVRQIRLKIKSLQQELQGDFQFNLPTFLGVPTTYEARRINQTEGGSAGIQDNRSVRIDQLNVNGVGDPDAVADKVIDKVAEAFTPGRSSTGTRRY